MRKKLGTNHTHPHLDVGAGLEIYKVKFFENGPQQNKGHNLTETTL